ncbi:hypothetical protein [Aurantiacibacter poecillastricola]|uniref:hypothetical protein n=1 Tax=Aurantiacibacter poecillastricola TaxID=3064385 RepID=UPI00273D3832|nr:hypothetical protein [Aurantiacibacter sp. 219JJ12-13]MDP5263509.1 hypothetical protein [Aurantiacibacter sp. 219JJ12-13]
MKVSARDTSKALQRHVIPLLQANGFNDATGRRFWRHRSGRTDHVDIASMSAYRAKVDNSTTESFTVRLAISLPRYGYRVDPYHRDHIKIGPKGPRPAESQMPIRGVLCPAGSPPLKEGRWGWECQSLWTVNSIEDAEEATIDLQTQLENYALDWLSRTWDLREIAALLETQQNRLFLVKADNGSHLQLDAELPGSPIRQAHISMAREALENDRQ